jgi:hypothetical protein
LSHFNYGILAWGHESDKLHKFQKRSVRIISLSKYNAHTDPLFKLLNLLKVMEIYKLNELKFYYKYVNDNLPYYFQQLPLIPNQTIHNHNTRYNQNIHKHRVNHQFSQLCIRYNIPQLINNTDALITSKFNTHSLQGLAKYVKWDVIQNYDSQCSIQNCYVCGRENH